MEYYPPEVLKQAEKGERNRFIKGAAILAAAGIGIIVLGNVLDSQIEHLGKTLSPKLPTLLGG